MPATEQDPGGCGCPVVTACPSPTLIGQLIGCNGLGLAGIAITAHDSTAGGTILGSTVTDGSGNFTLSGLVGATIGNAIVIVPAAISRFDPGTVRTLNYGGTLPGISWKCGLTTTGCDLNPAVSAGYVCGPSSCVYPLPTTLHLTDNVLGGATLTHTLIGGNHFWVGAWPSQSYGACGCPPATQVVNIFYAVFTGPTGSLYYEYAPGGTVGSQPCPGSVGGTTRYTPPLVSFACPMSFSYVAERTTNACNNFDVWASFVGGGVTETLVLTE